MSTTSDILTVPYLQLPFSKGLKKFMNTQGFETLEQLLKIPLPKLLEMQGFNYRSYKELYQFLEDKGLENELKAT